MMESTNGSTSIASVFSVLLSARSGARERVSAVCKAGCPEQRNQRLVVHFQ